jgi:DnaJ like chaperone protein
MVWQGKAIGALLGVLTAGPAGAIFGTFIGHLFDVQVESSRRLRGPSPSHTHSRTVQEAFFRATFQVMGHLAKADGRISAEEIRAARAMMVELRLRDREIQYAMDLYTQGKAPDFPLDAALQGLYDLCRNRPDLRRMFVQIQLQAALWGQALNPASRKVLSRVCDALGVSAYDLVQMEALLRMQRSTRQPGPETEVRPKVDPVAQSYEVLGVTVAATDAEVVKAYRRLMNQNHPDKLVAKGLPESMTKVAEEKTRQIRAAYEVLRDARGMK